MSENLELFYRDGTSQLQRTQAALQEDYIRIEERTIEDWLKFAQKYAEELNYYSSDNQLNGNWQAFLNGSVTVEDMLHYLQNPTLFESDPNKQEWLSRPHFVLFLTFLQLLEQNLKPSLNNILPRHLEYYYKQVLKFTNKAAQPDKVHVIFDLANNYANDRFLLPEKTALFAGKDSTGKDLVYRTPEKMMVSRAKVTQIKSSFVHYQTTQFDSYSLPSQFLEMLRLSLGQETVGTGADERKQLKPGEPLLFPGFLGYTTKEPDEVFFEKIQALVAFANTELYLSFADLRLLMRLKQNRDNDANEWNIINTELQKMKNGGSLTINASNLRDFVANFTTVTGHSPLNDSIYDELQSVNNIYNLYEELNFATTGDYEVFKPLIEPLDQQGYSDSHRVRTLRKFITEKFYTNSTVDDATQNQYANDFHTLVQARQKIYQEWRDMQEILNNIPQLPSKATFANLETPNFDELLASKYGNLPVFTSIDASLTNIDQYFDTAIKIEQYFALFIEEVDTLLQNALTLKNKKVVYKLLESAHQKKKIIIRQEELSKITPKTSDALFKEALGLPNPGDNYLPLPTGITSLEDLLTQVENDTANATAGIQYINDKLKLTKDNFKFIINTCQDHLVDQLVPSWKWDRVYLLLEEAERKMRGEHPASSPVISHRNGVYAFANAQDAKTNDQEETFERWRTFGQIENGKLTPLGLAIQSPVLALSAGERVIELNLTLTDEVTSTEVTALQTIQNALDAEGKLLHPFKVEITGENGWLPITTFNTLTYDSTAKVLKIHCQLASDFDPVQTYKQASEVYARTTPTLKVSIERSNLMMDQLTAQDLFSQIQLKKVDLKVVAQNIRPTLAGNDTTTLNPKNAFTPFGSTPTAQAKFYFTHPELIDKKLDNISINLNWLGKPADWNGYYNLYGANYQNPTLFKTTLDLHDQGISRRFSLNDATEDFELLNYAGAALTLDTSQEAAAAFPYLPLSVTNNTDDLFEQSRYFIVQLGTQDFGHAQYPVLASQKASELAIRMKGSVQESDAAAYQVNPPYTPEWQDFSFTYTASASDQGTTTNNNSLTVMHIHPFGYTTMDKVETTSFLPNYPQEGYLYLGIQSLKTPFDLNLLFRMAEGSANPELTPPAIDWRYLQGDQWQLLTQKGRIITDGSNGLLNTGIIKMRIPVEADTQHQVLPSGYHWLRASVRNNSLGLSDTIGIHAQAIEAVFEDQQNDPNHLKTPLPAETITRTYTPQPELKTVKQPYSSFGGQVREPEAQLNIRISERLRHKNRALTVWDYERLVLEAFPEVYKIKCLPGQLLTDSHPGQVVLITVPNISGIRPYDPFKPKLSVDILQKIQQYLTERASPTADIVVRNPTYLELRIYMQVVFHPEYQADHKYYLELLHLALQQYLAPWAFDNGADIALGGKLYPNLIVDFVERLEYIDYINNFSLGYLDGEDVYLVTQDQMQSGLTANRADGVWVSAREHRLSSIQNVGTGKNTGIGYMMVANDFTIA
ncbi:hypothetical protein BKI52_10005 [marine bacterium AO1-C]|nr:hypothetical protein BKI52_10005 [marine bacterium AO1-C]